MIKIEQNLKRKRYLFAPIIVIAIIVLFVNLTIRIKYEKFIYPKIENIPKCYTGIVLGAGGSYLLQDRMDNAIELYHAKKIDRFLLSGDHGQIDYDEVNNMKSYFISQGIDTMDIFLDHAGFDTYSSMYRAKEIFQVTDAIIITQKFHLPRAVYIARQMGLTAYGSVADKRDYDSINSYRSRELFANIKACFELFFNIKPKYLGDMIPITGNSELSYD
nr:ElyC/SanA/YdcF family protein [uncultured Allomuricauda sp.]